jgi:hypothetical protein
MTIRARMGWVLPGLAVFLMLGTVSMRAQEPGGAPARKAVNPAHRVPTYFAQVGLTPDQRQKVYSVREKYAARVADLKKQIADIQAEELADCEKVLTDSQKQLLSQFRSAGGRRSRAGAAEAPKPEPAPKPADAEKKD